MKDCCTARSCAGSRCHGVRLAFVWAIGAAVAAVSVPARAEPAGRARAGVFVERFASAAPGRAWVVEGPGNSSATGLEWSADPAKPGWRFNAAGVGRAYAPVDVGTAPFDLTWDVEIDRGTAQTWRYPGVWVGLSSAPPGKATGEDVTVLFALHRDGPSASVKAGEVFEPNRNPSGYPPPLSRFTDRDLSPRGALNAGGAGGRFDSLDWPAADLAGLLLRLEVRRDETGALTFRIFHPDLPAGPWWERTWRPQADKVGRTQGTAADVAKAPLRYLVVGKVLNPNDYRAPEKVAAGDSMSGWVRDIQLSPLGPTGRPTVASVSQEAPVLAGGGAVTLLGDGFEAGAGVEVGGMAARAEVTDDKHLRVWLPDLAPDRRYPVRVTNPSGLSGQLAGGIGYGRLIERVEPAEAVPGGGDEVTLAGAGLGPGTRVTVGGREARVLAAEPSRLRLRLPPGREGPAEVKASDGDATFAGAPAFGYAGHPYLLFHADDLPDLRRKFNDPAFAAYRAVILGNADAVPPEGAETEKSGTTGINDLLWAYLLGGASKHKEQLLRVAAVESRSLSHAEFRLMAAEDMATAYDALFPELTAAEKGMFEAYLRRVVRDYGQRLAAKDWWHANNPSNTVAVGAAGGGGAAMALMHSSPEAAAVVSAAADVVQHRYAAILPDGGNMEGTLYWNYGQGAYLRFAHMLASATGDDHGLLTRPGLREQSGFVATLLGGDGAFFAFGDTQPWLTGWAICADHGSRFHQPLLLWLADHMAEQFAANHGRAKESARSDVAPYAFLWRAREPAPDAAPAHFPGVPTVSKLGTMNWGVLRSNGSFQPELVVGVKGHGGPLGHHAQPDLGSFVLQAAGEPFLIDPGYYRHLPAEHSLLLIDDQAPGDGHKGEKATITDLWEQAAGRPAVRELVLDCTDAYPPDRRPRRAVRHFVLLGDKAAVVLDDVVPAAGREGKVTCLYQAGFPAEVAREGTAVTLSGGHSRLLLRLFGPPTSLKTKKQAWGKNDWVLGASGVQWTTLSADYQADPTTPMLTVLTAKRPAGQAPRAGAGGGAQAPEIAELHVRREAGAVRVEVADTAVEFHSGEQGWRREGSK